MTRIIGGVLILCCVLAVNVYGETNQEAQNKYLDGLVGKPIDVSGLYEGYGFIGIVESAAHKNGATLRLKGIIQKKRCNSDFWKSLERRDDRTVLKSQSGDEAVVLDCVLDIGGSTLLRVYDGYDKDTDEFLSKIKDTIPDTITIKAMILQNIQTEKQEILVQDKSRLRNFNNMVKEIGL
ncbi:MAG: hypothetical protein WC738_03365 [Candidatus Omnitrophota bacterium]|jgi:hypothetical protein